MKYKVQDHLQLESRYLQYYVLCYLVLQYTGSNIIYYKHIKMDSNDGRFIVTVNEGKLSGKTGIDYNGRTFYSFQGIPFAQPPVAELRFKAPQPPKKWTGIRDATVEAQTCIALTEVSHDIEGGEDCLYLNVYTPQLPYLDKNTKLKPVMVWIHGGGFTSGSGSSFIYGPEYLVAEDIVLVTLNYRTGVLGFLYFNDPSLGVPGNAGLKDQVMALRWVNNNIQQFGGDPNNVTIFGESAGGVSVEYHVLSPMSKGLFHKAIIQSGSALNAWSRCKYSVMALADALGIESNNEKEILDHLREVPLMELFKKSHKLKDNFHIGNARPYALVVEKPSKEPAFLSEEPMDILKSGRYNSVPLIMGHNSREGMYIYSVLQTRPGYILSPSTLIPHTWNLRKDSPIYNKVHNRIKDFYGFTKELDEINKDDIFRVYTHNYFVIDMYNSALHHIKKAPVYFYRFDVDAEFNMLKKMYNLESEGTSHADELAYLFKPKFFPTAEKGSTEDLVVRKMTKLWSNFAKHSNPTPTSDNLLQNVMWKPVTSSEFNYLDIGTSDLKLKKDPEKETMDFWNHLYKEKDVLQSKI